MVKIVLELIRGENPMLLLFRAFCWKVLMNFEFHHYLSQLFCIFLLVSSKSDYSSRTQRSEKAILNHDLFVICRCFRKSSKLSVPLQEFDLHKAQERASVWIMNNQVSFIAVENLVGSGTTRNFSRWCFKTRKKHADLQLQHTYVSLWCCLNTEDTWIRKQHADLQHWPPTQNYSLCAGKWHAFFETASSSWYGWCCALRAITHRRGVNIDVTFERANNTHLQQTCETLAYKWATAYKLCTAFHQPIKTACWPRRWVNFDDETWLH